MSVRSPAHADRTQHAPAADGAVRSSGRRHLGLVGTDGSAIDLTLGATAAARHARVATSAGHAFPVLIPHDVRLLDELPTRRLVAYRARTAASIAARVVVDASVIAGVAALVRYGAGVGSAAGTQPSIVTLLLVALLALAAAGEYEIAGRRHHSLATPLVACGLLAVVMPLLAMDLRQGWDRWSLVTLLGAITAALVVLAWVRRRAGRTMRRPNVRLRAAVAVGRERDLASAVAAFDAASAGAVIDRLPSAADRGQRGASLVDQLTARLARGDVREVVVVSMVRSLTLGAIADACRHAGVRCLAAFDARDVRVDLGLPVTIGGRPAVEVVRGDVVFPRVLAKRLLDLVLTVALLPVAVPLAVIVAVAIRIESRGAVLYRQRRVGLGGQEFVIWKFRSMHCEAPAQHASLSHLNHYGEAPLFKLKDDPRITRVGRMLRRTSLDELPQLVNVLRGEMSLVGPRPPLPEEVARYAPHHLARLTVLPGMTGPWQVGGRNLITDFEEIVRLERDYIDAWSLGRDLRILFQTIGVVVRGTGAY